MCFPAVKRTHALASEYVFPISDGLKMRRIDAAAVSAFVIYHLPPGNVSVRKAICVAVSIDALPPVVKGSVPAGVRAAYPIPAKISLFDFCQKLFGDRLIRRTPLTAVVKNLKRGIEKLFADATNLDHLSCLLSNSLIAERGNRSGKPIFGLGNYSSPIPAQV